MKIATDLLRAPMWTKLSWGALFVLCFFMIEHRVMFAVNHTPNILFWDQWDIYNPLFEQQGPWTIFSLQHGPHRQGLGGLLTAGLAKLTNWDVRGDAALCVIFTAGGLFCSFAVARRCMARPGLALLPLLPLFLTMRQFESWIGASNPAHSAVPLFLTMLYAWSWFIENPVRRWSAQILLTFLLTFTGFGLFLGVVSVTLLAVELWKSRSNSHLLLGAAVSTLLCLAVWALFFWNYKSQPAVPNFVFPHDRPLEYFSFSSLMFASYFNLQHLLPRDLLIGGLILCSLLGLSVYHGLKILRTSPTQSPASTVIFALSAATLLFCLNTAVGRVSLGWHHAPYASRYVTLIVPGLFALFLHFERTANTLFRNAAWVTVLAATTLSGLTLSKADESATRWYQEGRAAWKAAYLAKKSQAEADAVMATKDGFTIYPGDISHKLDYLRRHRLNLAESISQPESAITP
jgi:hypothetical protein